jgi:pilus assembly protein CpaF
MNAAAGTRQPLATAGAVTPERRALNIVEQEWKQRIFTKLLSVLDLSLIGSVEEAQAREQIREATNRLLIEESAPLSLAQRQAVVKQVEDEVIGHGPFEPLLADPAVADILVNGHDQVYVERKGKLELTNVRFNDDAHLMNIIDRIVSAVGRRIDESSPMVDARLKDGSRVNVIIPPLALDGPIAVDPPLRGREADGRRPDQFRHADRGRADVLRAIVRLRMNVLISGGTGAGKTTLLNILSASSPRTSASSRSRTRRNCSCSSRTSCAWRRAARTSRGEGEVTQRELVRNSLRMRPDRIVVGEVRGAEALDMLQAMNTGHDGSLTTVHANTPRDALGRIETMVSMTGISFPMKALRAQIASAVHIVVQTSRHEDGKRRVTSVAEINGMEGDIITMSEIFTFVRTGTDAGGNVQGQLKPTGVVPSFHRTLEARGIDLPVSVFRPEGRGR